ncbi:hypothetical protein K8T06_09765, partial [bacterium]|nr:hypothetical protein [bacterium]
MKRLLILVILVLTAVTQSTKSSNDRNAMDDIGFDSTFGYYKSANETINMQTGNVILKVPVSPLLPGPEGSGLDLQLNTVYNSHNWRYKPNEDYYPEPTPTHPPNCDPIHLDALVDIKKMYYSSAGFGWTLHMGRLFRLTKDLPGDCQSTQFYYEDSSGATHAFGPYCDEGHENRTFKSKNASGYVLMVTGFDTPDQKIVMFDGTGRKLYFGNAQNLPILPNDCNGNPSLQSPDFDSDKVFYVKKILAYNQNTADPSLTEIRIDYLNTSDPPALFYGHQMSKITAPFGRVIDFEYEDILTGGAYWVPRLQTIQIKGFKLGDNDTLVKYVFSHDITTIHEPWGEAECDDITSGVFLHNQLFLKMIDLPEDENLAHHFSYNDAGEIAGYTNPLGARTDYYFKDVINEAKSYIPDSGCSSSVGIRIYYYNPSRFIYKKKVTLYPDDGNPTQLPDYVWEYAVSMRDNWLGEYDSEPIFAEDRSFGGTRPASRVKDPDGNETVYQWICESARCTNPEGDFYQFYCPYGFRYWLTYISDNSDCPDDDNSKNGRLERVKYYDGELPGATLLKETVFNYTDGDEVYSSPYMRCHDNPKIDKANIRLRYQTTYLYGPSGCVTSTELIDEYDEYGNVLRSTSNADGVSDIIMERSYKDLDNIVANNPDASRYKVDFLEWKKTTSNGEVLSFFCNEESGNTGRVGIRLDAVEWDTIPENILYTTTNFEYYDSCELEWQQIEGSPRIEYGHSAGAIEWKKVGGLLVEDNVIDVNTGLVKISRDISGNETEYAYDALNRMTWTKPPGSDRYPLDIRYSKSQFGLWIEYERHGVDLQVHWIDTLGNHSFQKTLVYFENSVDYLTVKDTTFDWRNLRKRTVYPDSSLGVNYTYDCLGRLVQSSEEKSTPATITEICYDVWNNVGGCYGILKKVAVDGIEKFYLTDLRNNLIEVVGGLPAGHATYTYDDKGNLTQVSHGNTVRTFTYDMQNRNLNAFEPETGGVDFGGTQFVYHDDGKVKYKVTPEGNIYYFYDEHNRLLRVECPEGQKIRGYGYDEESVSFSDNTTVQIAYGEGRLTSLMDIQYQDNTLTKLAYSYNRHGDIISESVCVDPVVSGLEPKTYTTNYIYDFWGNLSGIKYPVSETWIHYGNEIGDPDLGITGPWATNIKFYDPTYPDKTRTVVPNIYYNATGGLKQIEYDNKVRINLEKDDAHRIKEIKALNSVTNKEYFQQNYFYDGLDRIKKIGNKEYIYHTDNSLKEVWIGQKLKYFYTYDSSGNMTSRSVSDRDDLSFGNYSYTNNQLEDSGFSDIIDYDHNGNVVFSNLFSINNQSYQFTPENRMTGASISPLEHVRFLYDGNGKRRLKISPDQAELFFYDPSGNNLLEKLTYDLANPDKPKIQKDECFVNFSGRTVAQFDYLEPVTEIKFRDNMQSVFYPGDTFDLFLDYQYEGPTQEDVWHFAILAVHGSYYFLPDGDPTPEDLTPLTLRHGRHQLQIMVPFTMPDSLDDIDGLYIISMLATSYENNEPRQFGNIAIREFKLRSAPPNFYVKNGPTNGTTVAIDDPFNSIEAAIQAVPIGEHATIKLFPGTYTFTDPVGLVLDYLDVDIIGSGQARTTIRGSDPLVSKIEFMNGNYVLQGLTNEANLECMSSSMEIRNVCLQSQGAYEGITAYANSHLRVKNTLITGYLGGITLVDSDAAVQNCTIDSCWGDYGFEFAGILSES